MKAYPVLRVSTKHQAEQGQGLESQFQFIQYWLEQHPDYELAEPLELDGYSAYSKKHLPLIKKFVTSLPANSTIVFTEHSRLARMDVEDAHELLAWIRRQGVSVGFAQTNTILQAGVKLDAMTYQQLTMMFEVARAESAIKSMRINNTFKLHLEQLRAGNRIKRTGFPKWLKLVDDNYEVDSYDRETIELIFELKLQGQGCYNITKHLNEHRTPFKGIKNWSYSYTNQILRSKMVIGVYQPVETYQEDGKSKRKPKGEPIENFYPRIISDETFYRAQLTFKTQPKGAKSNTFNNVYRGVLRCYCCHGSMSINRTKYAEYVRCEHKKSKINTCTNKSTKYSIIDERISTFLRSFDVTALSTGKPSQEAIRGELEQVQKSISQVTTAIATVGSDVPELVTQLVTLKQKRDDLQQQLLVPTTTPTDPKTINKVDDPDTYNKCIRDLFESIEVSPRYTKFTFNDVLNRGLPTVTIDHEEVTDEIDVMKMINEVYEL